MDKEIRQSIQWPSAEDCRVNIRNSPISSSADCSDVHSNWSQHHSRCLIQKSGEVLVFGQGVFQQLRPAVPAGSRSFCFLPDASLSPVCHARPFRQIGSVRERFQSALELDDQLCISTSSSYQQRDRPPEQMFRHTDSNNTGLVAVDLVSGGCPEEPQSASENSFGGTSDLRPSNQSVVTFGEQVPTDLVEALLWAATKHQLSVEVRELLVQSWRHSTLKTYQFPWKRWRLFSQRKQFDPFSPSTEVLADWVSALFHQGLSYSAINTHRSMVSAIVNVFQPGSELGSAPLVKRVLSAIANVRPPPAGSSQSWDLSLLTDHLKSVQHESLDWSELQKKTAVLVLISSGRRVHDLTLLDLGPENFTDVNNVITFKPKFGSKTDASSRRSNMVRLMPNPDSQLCPVVHIRKTISFWPEESKSNAVFRSPTNFIYPASVANIRKWVQEVLRAANIQATPGSLRHVVAQQAHLDGQSINQIMVQGNWRRPQTLNKHYLRK
jgi:hypothetical protein